MTAAQQAPVTPLEHEPRSPRERIARLLAGRPEACEFAPGACTKCGIWVETPRGPQWNLCAECKGALIPAKSPFKTGARVQMHGHPGHQFTGHNHPESLDCTGFTGTVTSSLGGQHDLVVEVDGGRGLWTGHWTLLFPEGARTPRGYRCTCCPRPPAQGALW